MSIYKTAEPCEEKRKATATNNNDELTGTSHGSGAREVEGEEDNGALYGDASSVKPRDTRLRLFSRELAVRLNPKRPDLNGAMILYGLYLWQRSRVGRFDYIPMVAGERGAYRSLSELQEEYPWLSEEGIRQAIERAEQKLKSDFVVDRDNPDAERGKLHFRISDRLIKKYGFNKEAKKGFVQVETQDAVDYGDLAAILLGNLRFVTDKEHNTNPLRDEDGNIYRELSATKLTRVRCDRNADEKAIIPRSRKAVCEAIALLRDRGAIIEHCRKAGFYRLRTPSDGVTNVAGAVTNLASAVTKVASGVTNVAGQMEKTECKTNNNSDLRQFCEMPDTNTDAKADTNSDSKCLSTATASRCSPVTVVGENVSPCGKKLMELVNQNLSACAHVYSPHRKVSFVGDEFCEGTTLYLPNSDLEVSSKSWHEDLPYDIISVHPGYDFAFSRKVQIDEAIEDFLLGYTLFNAKPSKQDIAALRSLFEAHPCFQLAHLEELWAFTEPQRNPEGFGQIRAMKKGWDFCYWALRVTDLKTFLRYRRQLVREWYVYNKVTWAYIENYNDEREGPPQWDYSEMEEPYFSIAFAGDEQTPVTYKETAPYDPIENGDPELRPVYYAEFVGEPTMEYVEHDANPVFVAA